MNSLSYLTFRQSIEDRFISMEHQDSVQYQLIDLTDLFQKIRAIYEFAQKQTETSLQNPILFQIVESALFYGVCIPIRRLADGSQQNEISLYKIGHEIKSNCRNWSRLDFVTFGGLPYDSTALRIEHQKEVDRLLGEAIKNGTNAAWIPRGQHEEIERRHAIFDLLSLTKQSDRKENDLWSDCFARKLISMLENSSSKVVRLANLYLAHRVYFSPERRPDFNVPLDEIESCIVSLWQCFNVLNSIFFDSYTSPDIVHSLDSFKHLNLAVVPKDDVRLIDAYEKTKDRMENAVNIHSREWQSDFLSSLQASQN